MVRDVPASCLKAQYHAPLVILYDQYADTKFRIKQLIFICKLSFYEISLFLLFFLNLLK